MARIGDHAAPGLAREAPALARDGRRRAVELIAYQQHGVALIAPVPSGLPEPVAPTPDGFDELLPGAFAIAIMVFLETLPAARAGGRPGEAPIDNGRRPVASSNKRIPIEKMSLR